MVKDIVLKEYAVGNICRIRKQRSKKLACVCNACITVVCVLFLYSAVS